MYAHMHLDVDHQCVDLESKYTNVTANIEHALVARTVILHDVHLATRNAFILVPKEVVRESLAATRETVIVHIVIAPAMINVAITSAFLEADLEVVAAALVVPVVAVPVEVVVEAAAGVVVEAAAEAQATVGQTEQAVLTVVMVPRVSSVLLRSRTTVPMGQTAMAS